MASFQTIKNSLKKLENKEQESDKYPHSGVIFSDEYEKLVFPEESFKGNRRKVGYLVVERPFTTVQEWEAEYAR